ncbi:hypothetical protein SELMODRAFT_430416 [Selaginella moellendorffii]|uniref:Uncharacterized protein n=1 Tax=Selaginella moellendorffii TaxID=88036 RepID=D8T9C5_SELML|nr:hypothetical protein SELMODRAFT_430416 [Selaginella moellendorffii]
MSAISQLLNLLSYQRRIEALLGRLRPLEAAESGSGRAFCSGVELTAVQEVFKGDVKDESADPVIQMEKCMVTMMQFPARRPRTARGSTSSLYEEMAKELSRQSIEINCGMCGRRPMRIEYEIEVASCICWRTVELKYLCTVPDVGFRLTSTKSYINPSQTNWKKYEGYNDILMTVFQFYVKATVQAGIPKVADVSGEYGCV